MAGHAADHARSQRIAEAAVDAYAEAAALPEGQGLRVAVERYGAAPSADAKTVASRFESGRGAGEARRQSDLDCLAQAVYYEARGESPRGQAAVAQVVLNRVKHPAFPRTVCGVVYQGANGRGCQFSFACDGSMKRRREARAWKRAHEVASRALSGALRADIGSATHFHTTAVSPGWAPQMMRVASVGTHVFYKFAPRHLRPAPDPSPETVVLASAAALADAADLRIVPAVALETAEASAEAKPVPAVATDPKAVKTAAEASAKPAGAAPAATKPVQTAAAAKPAATPQPAAPKPAPAKAAPPATSDAAALGTQAAAAAAS